MTRLFDFMQRVYGLFGFEFSLELSTRPEKFLGDIATWDKAEAVSLASTLLSKLSLTCSASNSLNHSIPTILENGS